MFHVNVEKNETHFYVQYAFSPNLNDFEDN
jgi:hypothetical protein